MKMTKEIEEFLNLAITEHMGKAYTDWKLKQQTDTEPDKVEEEYEKVIVSLSPEQEEAITMLYSTVEQIQRNSFIDWD